MPSRHPALVLAALSLLAIPVLAVPALAQEYQCRRGDLVRWVEVEFADDADRLPCRVLYWKDGERRGRPQVPWNAQNEADFCPQKARELVQTLRSAGWTCTDASPSESAGNTAPATEPTAREPAAQEPPRARQNGPAQPADAALQEALARDIRRLDELAGRASWRFVPDMAVLGDLDRDGVHDGAVLLSHRDGNGVVSHHLLAYLSDGATFRPVARVNLDAYYQNVREVEIEGITDGAIKLLLHLPRAGDRSGRRQVSFELRDGELVLAGESESGA